MKEESQDVKNILGLQLATDPRWVNLAEMGYVPVHRESNGECPYCEEFVVVKAFR
jgi:hypothetical protein